MIASSEKRSNVLYVAGPMTGYPEHNFPAFNAVADRLRADGWTVYNPADHGAVEGATWDDYMAYDLTKVGLCGAMYMLKGWDKSKGAILEHFIAKALSFDIMYQEDSE